MVRWLNGQAIYVLWLREMKKNLRAKSRLVGTLGMPVFFLIFMGVGFKDFHPATANGSVDYLSYLAPGMLAVVLQFGAMFTGMAILWDRQHGFLREIMVAPVSRTAIILGRSLGGVTTAFVQGALFMGVAYLTGMRIQSWVAVIQTCLLMLLISAVFVNLGLLVASFIHDVQGFSLVMSFIMIPIFLLSGATFPMDQFPLWVRGLTYVNPLFYGVEGLRFCIVGAGSVSLYVVFGCLAGCVAVTTGLGTFFFSNSETK